MTFLVLIILIVAFGISYSTLSGRIKYLEDIIKKIAPSDVILESRVTTTPEKTAPVPQPVIVAKIEKPPESKPTKPRDLEQQIGGKAFTGIGVIAVLFGVGFFLRYAFENNLISPIFRVALGFIASIIALGLGEWLRKKYPKYGQTLMGLGLGIAYLTWYATLNSYHLIASPFAFVGMMLVTILGLVLAIRLDSPPLAIFAQIGGFLTPMLVGGNENHYMVLFSYVLILNIAVLAIAYKKSWQNVTLVGMIGTFWIFVTWFMHYHFATPWAIPAIFITLYFILFGIMSLVRYATEQTRIQQKDLFVLIANPLLYGLAIYSLIPRGHDLLLGSWTFAIGVFYLILTYLVQATTEDKKTYQNILAILGTIFLAISIPILFDGVTVTITWAILATALIALSYTIRSKILLISAHILGIFPILSSIGREQDVDAFIAPWTNSTFWSAIGVIACFCVTAVMHWRQKKERNPLIAQPTEQNTLISFVLIEAYILSCTTFFFEMQRSSIEHILTIAVLSILALLGAWIGASLHSFGLRVSTYITFGLIGLAFIIFSISASFEPAILNERFLTGIVLIISMAICGNLYRFYEIPQNESRVVHNLFFTGANLLILSLVSTEIRNWFNNEIQSNRGSVSSLIAAKNTALSVAWTIHAIILLIFGILKKFVTARKFAIILFSLAILKAFLYDSSTYSNFYRFISFMTLGVLLLFSGYLYHRFKDHIKKLVSE